MKQVRSSQVSQAINFNLTHVPSLSKTAAINKLLYSRAGGDICRCVHPRLLLLLLTKGGKIYLNAKRRQVLILQSWHQVNNLVLTGCLPVGLVFYLQQNIYSYEQSIVVGDGGCIALR